MNWAQITTAIFIAFAAGFIFASYLNASWEWTLDSRDFPDGDNYRLVKIPDMEMRGHESGAD